MKKHLFFAFSSMMVVGLLASCGGQNTPTEESKTTQEQSSTAASSQPAASSASSAAATSQEGPKIEKKDPRKEAYSVVSATMNAKDEVEELETIDGFKSMYEAINYVLDEEDPGSFVYLTSDKERTPLFKKFKASYDLWHYYKDGNVLDGFYTFTMGDVEFFKGERYTRVVASSGYASQTYQPYQLMGHENATTQAWNRLPLLDASVRYNPHAFTGIQDSTYTVELSKSQIRPSYSELQKSVPTLVMSTTASYNWSSQGLRMDEETGEWRYFQGETQSDFKSLTEEDEVIMTSTWDNTKQEWVTPYDVRFSLSQVYDDTEDAVSNDLKIELLQSGEVKKTVTRNYEMSQMTMRGTHRFAISLDMEPRTDDFDEESMTPDFQCGAYLKNIVVSEGKGSVREGLNDDIYKGDAPMCCEAGKTYDLLYSLKGYENDADTEVIIDNVNAIKYLEDNANKDTWNISFEAVVPEVTRTEEVVDVEELIAMIPDNADETNDEFLTAYASWRELHVVQQELISQIDGYRAIERIIGE